MPKSVDKVPRYQTSILLSIWLGVVHQYGGCSCDWTRQTPNVIVWSNLQIGFPPPPLDAFAFLIIKFFSFTRYQMMSIIFVSSVRSSYSHPDLLVITHFFSNTPVFNTGLSLSEPLQLYKGYNAI